MTPEQMIREARVMAGRLSMASADPASTVQLCQATALILTRLLLQMSDALAAPQGVQIVSTDNATIKVGRALERAEIVRLLQEHAERAAEAGVYHASGSRRTLSANAAAAALETAAADVKRRGGSQ